MRILGFSKKWDKLQQDTWTTFRFERRDKDWQVGEVVKVVFQPRRKGGGELLGVAEIIGKGKRWVGSLKTFIHYPIGDEDFYTVSFAEAVEDGFSGVLDMRKWISKSHKDRNEHEPMNKLTLKWVERR